MPRLPVVSGYDAVRLLEKIGYQKVRQKGSHLTLKKLTVTGEHSIQVPLHDELDKGTLNSILTRVSERNIVEKEKLVELLSGN
ncbi:type II toxin-antitoxin system HicA family toxin [Methanocella sp. CWC-04]|uniref:Type II toxin-antitoxin system HicA family toxin n=1 Tax=Methanooceanicella nereidis TaxID=2052831 RepID=A0AAP2RE54_9EURY|nr:type II toxin-antitoxin system HicA family toxin [Methanocella sp. CWC-04]MCD1296011.1 type II toxin-antitoxin system HicA family toxin [Methanocella sp. CWC-04]